MSASNVKRVLESETRTLLAQEIWEVEGVLAIGGLVFNRVVVGKGCVVMVGVDMATDRSR